MDIAIALDVDIVIKLWANFLDLFLYYSMFKKEEQYKKRGLTS